jgi:hypothetical protein
MSCLVLLIALGAPRFALFLVWLFGNYLGTAYESNLYPILGFFFAPVTTLAYAWSMHTHGGVRELGMLVVILAVLMDLGLIGASRKRRS